MKFVFAALMLVASTVQAGEIILPIPAVNLQPIADQGLKVANCCRPVVICRTIRIEDPDNIAPCAIPTQITVCDPYTCRNVVLIVCMPPQQIRCCGPIGIVKAEISRRGRKVKYDYGKYEVEIHFSRREIVIDYDD